MTPQVRGNERWATKPKLEVINNYQETAKKSRKGHYANLAATLIGFICQFGNPGTKFHSHKASQLKLIQAFWGQGQAEAWVGTGKWVVVLALVNW